MHPPNMENNTSPKIKIGKWYSTYIEEASTEENWDKARPIHEFIMKNYGEESSEKVDELEQLISQSELTTKQERYFNRALKWMKGRLETNNTENLGRVVRLYREQKNMTLRDLAKASEVSPSYINKIENGKRQTVSLPVLKKIAKGLEQDPEIFIRIVTGNESKRPSLVQILESENFTLDGHEINSSERAALVSMIKVILDANFKENSHIDSIEVINAVSRFKAIQNGRNS